MTMHAPQLILAVPAAIAGAASFGLASAVQQRATRKVTTLATLNPRLLLALIRDPVWAGSVLTVILGLALQMVALAFAPLVLVQPLLMTTVLFGAAFAAWLGNRRVDRILTLGALACAVGLSGFLLLARPSGQGGEFTEAAGLPLTLGLAVLVAASLVASTGFPGEIRVIALAVATGVLYGVTAGLIKAVAHQFRTGGLGEPFQHWPLYVVCAIGPVGFLLSQNTFQQGKLISPALAVITTVDPLVAIAIGVSWFGEHIVATPSALAGETIAALVLLAGIVVLTHRGEHLRRTAERGAEGNGPARSTWG